MGKGKFQAYKNEDDQATNEFEASDNFSYYKKILEKSKIALESFNSSEINLEDGVKKFWKSSSDTEIIGIIKQDKHHAKDKNSLLRRIAEEENKYYYKWLEEPDSQNKEYHMVEKKDDNMRLFEVLKRLKDNEIISEGEARKYFDSNKIEDQNLKILNNLKRLNVLIYDKIFSDFDTWDNNVDLQEVENKIFLPLAVSSIKKDNSIYWIVYVNKDAKALYLDLEDTSAYQYEHKTVSKDNITDNDMTGYATKRTWNYSKKKYDDNRNGEHSSDRTSSFAYYDYNKDKRYLKNLQNSIKSLANGKGLKLVGSSVYNFKVSEKSLLCNFKNDNNKKIKASLKAETDSHPILKEFNCFYYEDESVLKSLLSSVSIAEGSGGLSGYAMRADKVSEVDYRWSITANSDEDKHLAKLLSYVMGLERDKFDDEYKIPISDGKTDGFFPTNWPSDKVAGIKTNVTGMKSLFHYYKKFEIKALRRNKPDERPAPPRISHSDANSYSYKYDGKKNFKLDNTSYRIWKKGIDFTGEVLKTANQERQDAGSVMAEALNQFQLFYSDLVSKSNKKATNAKLPATAFAKYVVVNDNTAKKQWAKDTEAPENTINQDSVKTDQEWCHLFGHGDGGSEELGNFVSGSKHCNTEQLAIETGQRRISQNESIKVELRAKITAYLMPNQGAWIGGEKTEVKQLLFGKNPNNEEWKELLFGKKTAEDITDSADQTLWNDFFTNNDNGNYTETQLKNLFQKLSHAIGQKSRDKKGREERAKLFEVRRKLEKGFFIYLPLGRWMRYKIYYNDKKIFDHIYDAQSQSFDYNECQILDYTVERAIYKGLDEQKFLIKDPDDSSKSLKAYDFYKKKIKERVKDLVPNEKEVELLDKILDLDRRLNEMVNSWKQIDNLIDNIQKKANELSKEAIKRYYDYFKAIINEYEKAISEYSESFKEIAVNFNSLKSLPGSNTKYLEETLSELNKNNEFCSEVFIVLKEDCLEIGKIIDEDLMKLEESCKNAKKRKRNKIEITDLIKPDEKRRKLKMTARPKLEATRSLAGHSNFFNK